MTAHWVRRAPVAADVPEASPARVCGSIGPAGALVIGRFLNTVVVTLHGALTLGASEGLAGALRDLIDGQANLAVVVHLADVHGIDHAGVSVLSAAAGKIATHGGQLQLAGPTGVVLDSLVLAGLGRLVTVPLSQAHHPASPARSNAAPSRRAGSTLTRPEAPDVTVTNERGPGIPG